jgi:vacuolar-type H+-ATPase subunit F/Vma7
MSMRLWVIADEVTVAGWRLAGATVQVPGVGGAAECLRRARGEADLVLLGDSLAASLPREELRTALQSCKPWLLLIGDGAGHTELQDLDREVARALGVSP